MVLGMIQGLTEFLPVSSSGHLEIVKSIFGVDPERSFYFTVAVHGATVLSTIVVFWKEIIRLIGSTLKFKMNEDISYVLKIIVSMVPVGFTGILLKDPVEELFNGNLLFVGSMLLITAAFLVIAHFIKKKERQIGYLDAIIIGIAQAFAVIPGISRSGATIAAGLMIGNRKDEIAKFSFLMVLIPVIAANMLELFSNHATTQRTGSLIILIGFFSAFVTGYIACRWMITLVRRSKLLWFSVYCAVAGMISILLW